MIDILKYCLPALCVLFATWLVMHKFYKSETEKRLWELKRLSQKEISPLRMRAYERLALLLERTMPEHMLLDLNLAEMTPMEVQTQLMRTIRQEYDHIQPNHYAICSMALDFLFVVSYLTTNNAQN